MSLYIAVESFTADHHGQCELIHAGDIAESGSFPVETRPSSFRPLQIRWKAPPAKRNQRRWVLRHNGQPWFPVHQHRRSAHGPRGKRHDTSTSVRPKPFLAARRAMAPARQRHPSVAVSSRNQ